ncbi:hypothetical protein [Actinokineospora sp. UTMC 2448]|uniref:hypothetical protein n=1 Tax=Actinokineospora sp. UTMC 2448 TaxID=2268449 RepID=UPI00216474BF|nr:hypothetical protein [Actinokineospora sp. UTMC 2448]UVS79190.1 hypothetical protein Actkin_02936 [Actinokineospora sp. UTMC 2448]
MTRSRGLPIIAAGVVLFASACDETAEPGPSSTAPTTSAAASDPDADPRSRLARELAPAVWLADGEVNLPMDASRFVAGADLWFDHGKLCKDDKPVATEVSESGLASGEYSHPAASTIQPHSEDPLPCTHDEDATLYRTNSAERQVYGDGRGFYLDLDDDLRRGDGATAPVYWQHVGDPDGHGAFVYWLFYGYNDFINNHEGDWERVAVQVDGGHQTGMVFWRHNEPACHLPWNRLEFAGNRPVAYAAKGSHGSYPRAGAFPLATTAVADRTSAGTPWHTWESLRSVEEEPWWGYRGLWGVIGPESLGASGIAGPNPDRRPTVEYDALTTLACPAVDRRFLGDWESRGPVEQPGSGTAYHARLSLRDGDVGDEVGTSHYPELGCTGSLKLLESAPEKLVVLETITSDPRSRCASLVTITLGIDGESLSYSADYEPGAAEATLVRQ